VLLGKLKRRYSALFQERELFDRRQQRYVHGLLVIGCDSVGTYRN
jgi:hypothetical protein